MCLTYAAVSCNEKAEAMHKRGTGMTTAIPWLHVATSMVTGPKRTWGSGSLHWLGHDPNTAWEWFVLSRKKVHVTRNGMRFGLWFHIFWQLGFQIGSDCYQTFGYVTDAIFRHSG